MKRDEKRGLRTEPGKFRTERQIFTQSSALSPQSVHVHIEALVLHGFKPGDRYPIKEAVERELGRLFAEQGVLSSLVQSRDITRLDGGVFEMAVGSKAETIGTQVAQALYGGLVR